METRRLADFPDSLGRSLALSSLATLAGLFAHYAAFYTLRTPLLTDQIAEWIMKRTPSSYAVAILGTLGPWAKPYAVTGGLATLGFGVFLARLLVGMVSLRRPAFVVALFGFGLTLGVVCAACLAGSSGTPLWSSLATFWLPALLCAALVRLPEAPVREQRDPIAPASSRRVLLGHAVRWTVPAVMASGVVGVVLESFYRERALARQATVPVRLFPFVLPERATAFGSGLTRAAITPLPQFYGMSKNTVDPAVDVRLWRLRVTLDGSLLRSLAYDELLGLGRERRYVTLRCISNTLRSDLMGTAEWAGFPLASIIDRRSLPARVLEVAFIGVDGHDDSLLLDYAFGPEALLAFGMNGKTLSRTHGFPLRLLAPRYYGCRNVKWIGEIRFVTRPYSGTWQRLGYTREPVIHTASHIDRYRRTGDLLEVGGVSFAGSRGIRAVRVRADQGPWAAAQLEAPLSQYTWTRWVGCVPARPGALLEANAQDGNGQWQELVAAGPFPTGPMGPTVLKTGA